MRSVLVALLLSAAALAVLPSASAMQELPVGCNAEVGACVFWDQPNGDCVGVHVGFQGAGACASSETGVVRACTSLHTVLSEPCPTDTVYESISLPDVTCNPDLAGVCVSIHSTGVCAGVNFGLQGAGACATTNPVGVRVCSSLYIRDIGNCPTDILTTVVE